ncbi:hypothetical protein MKW98_029483 [Papaver atlanticum]|uniref:Mannosyl-oligosaccharide glucosidase n=1 Tax=Papaver atlanticum TaxID=357466 RepID=A0AAD4SJ96_9MAGN|nr:hypothetical protein MKW98_029483 [Papaver atlanticum]
MSGSSSSLGTGNQSSLWRSVDGDDEEGDQQLRVNTPFPAPKIMDLPQFQGEHKESLYWGTYRPHVYLGIRTRTPRSLMAGLIWIGVKDGKYVIRHVCEDSDEISKYGWTHHNGRDYGNQVIVDHGMTLTTEFLKTKEDGCGYGGDWALRIDAQIDKDNLDEELWGTGHLFFYLAEEEDSNVLSIGREKLDTPDSSLLAYGSREDIGGWELHIDSTDDLEIHYSGFRTPHFHKLAELVQNAIGSHETGVGLLQPDTSENSPNVLVFQISAKFPVRADISFVSGTGLPSSRDAERVKNITGKQLSNTLIEKQKEFDEKFNRLFNLTDKVSSEAVTVGRAALGNLIGGIGYFYGQSKISLTQDMRDKHGKDFVPYWPAEMYTAVPGRTTFPRGFLWDEGFHQLLICRWDIKICLDIIGHWLDMMNVDGWIPRELVLGTEALSKIPEEYVAQHPTNGNPPTLFLALKDLVNGTSRNQFTTSESNEITSFLDSAFVRLEAWFQWFHNTQSGKDVSSYYWHGRDQTTNRQLNPQTLTSGFDDYPRASHPGEEERHLDLRCWMLFAADRLNSITKLLGNHNEVGNEYESTVRLLSDFELLNKMHLDDVSGAYFDFGNHTEKVRLVWRDTESLGSNPASQELIREVMEIPQLSLVPHLGYVSLFPFMTGIIPSESPILGKQLDHIFDRSELWTDFGVLSLAKSSTLYDKYNTEHEAPYWRGSIWMNMNYMILSALHHYSTEDGPYKLRARTIYEELRQNLIRNVVDNYFKTGYIWEQYDQKNDGKGRGVHPFTGWTSLILLIMAETYPEI